MEFLTIVYKLHVSLMPFTGINISLSYHTPQKQKQTEFCLYTVTTSRSGTTNSLILLKITQNYAYLTTILLLPVSLAHLSLLERTWPSPLPYKHPSATAIWCKHGMKRCSIMTTHQTLVLQEKSVGTTLR